MNEILLARIKSSKMWSAVQELCAAAVSVILAVITLILKCRGMVFAGVLVAYVNFGWVLMMYCAFAWTNPIDVDFTPKMIRRLLLHMAETLTSGLELGETTSERVLPKWLPVIISSCILIMLAIELWLERKQPTQDEEIDSHRANRIGGSGVDLRSSKARTGGDSPTCN